MWDTGGRLILVSLATAILLAVGLIFQTSEPTASASQRLAADHRVSLPAGFGEIRTGMSAPMLAHGQLLEFRRAITSAVDIAFKVASVEADKSKGWTAKLWIPGATAVRIESAALTPGGNVLAGGLFTKAQDGAAVLGDFVRGGPSRAPEGHDHFDEVRNFVVELDSAGSLLRNLDVGSYSVQRLCSSEDGTFWTLGQDWSEERKGAISETNHLLRHYSAAGDLIKQFIPRRVLGPANGRLNNFAMQEGASTAFLACGQKATVVYLARAMLGFFFYEVTTDNGETRNRRVVRLPGVVMTGLAVLPDGAVYGAFGRLSRPRGGTTSPASDRGASSGQTAWAPAKPGLYRLDSESRPAAWRPTDAAGSDPSTGLLVGVDRDSLVHWQREPSRIGAGWLTWTAMRGVR